MNDSNNMHDVIVVGAGMAGTLLARQCALAGYGTVLIDSRGQCLPTFKAEKLEADQVELLRQLDCIAELEAVSAPIDGVISGRAGKIVADARIAQRGAPYHDMVNALRRQLPPLVTSMTARVVDIQADAVAPSVVLADGTRLQSRLVVVATGAAEGMARTMGVTRRMISEGHSVALGFTLAHAEGCAFGFDALTYHPAHFGSQLDYLTLFAIPGGLRANLFAYLPPDSPLVERLRRDTLATLRYAFDGLERHTGPLALASKVEARPIDLWVSDPSPLHGVVLIGDAFQSVCPATGTGLSKVLTDVHAAMRHLSAWMASPDRAAPVLAAFYSDPHKVASDHASLSIAMYRRRLSTDRGVRMRMHRTVERLREAFRPLPKPRVVR